ncbi:MAG: hypothetical protein IKW28_00420, partial [Lachnospiraceae bacterium]|nr:hypothetical protein [Lachnospiraceae bacterium]
EIYKILKGERTKMEELDQQIKRYLEVEQFDKNASVYINHDRLSILYLVNYLEKENSPIELEYEDFRECDTYLEFMAIVYRKWILRDLYLK